MTTFRFYSLITAVLLSAGILILPDLLRLIRPKQVNRTYIVHDSVRWGKHEPEMEVKWTLIKTTVERQKVGEPKETMLVTQAEVINPNKNVLSVTALKLHLNLGGVSVATFSDFMDYQQGFSGLLVDPSSNIQRTCTIWIPSPLIEEVWEEKATYEASYKVLYPPP